MNRREFVHSGSALALALTIDGAGNAFAQDSGVAPAVPFSHDWLLEEARRIAGEAYVAPSNELPDGYGDLSYDQYRDIWFKPEQSIWAGDPSPFRLDLFHRGFIYKDAVEISVVEGGQARPLAFSTALFGYGHLIAPPPEDPNMGFSGFRVRTQINTPGSWQEFLVFQGASYFRAVARNQLYGLSARGLALNTAEPEGEEFPNFRRFWIEKPSPDSASLIVHALLDSPSTTGAYRFEITAGMETVIDVSAAIFPRQEIQKVGIAPLTSMFVFNAMNRSGFDDFRRAVHDSDGLQILTGAGEWIWRPLCNPSELQVSYFKDKRPQGFGLMQRARRYEDFEDLEAAYQRRPSLWIEPLGDWGDGFVELVEIPTRTEVNDNVVAYWRPNGPVPAGGPWRFDYRMRWTEAVRPQSELLYVSGSHSGIDLTQQRRVFVIDFHVDESTPARFAPERLALQVSATHGEIVNAHVHEKRPEDAIRVSFELDPGSEELSELRLLLTADGKPASETWLYRWTAS